MEILKVKFWHVFSVLLAEWVKKVDSVKWKKEWEEMGESQRQRYIFILENYNGLIKKKIN